MVKKKWFGCTLLLFLYVVAIGLSRATSHKRKSTHGNKKAIDDAARFKNYYTPLLALSSTSLSPSSPSSTPPVSLRAASHGRKLTHATENVDEDYAKLSTDVHFLESVLMSLPPTSPSTSLRDTSPNGNTKKGSMTSLKDKAVLPQDSSSSEWQTVVRRKAKRNKRLGKDKSPDQGGRTLTSGTENGEDAYDAAYKTRAASPKSASPTKKDDDGYAEDYEFFVNNPEYLTNTLRSMMTMFPVVRSRNGKPKISASHRIENSLEQWHPENPARIDYHFKQPPKGRLLNYFDKDDCVVQFSTKSDKDYLSNTGEDNMTGYVHTRKEEVSLIVFPWRHEFYWSGSFYELSQNCNVMSGGHPVTLKTVKDRLLMTFHVGPSTTEPEWRKLIMDQHGNCVAVFTVFTIDYEKAADYWERMVKAKRLSGAVDQKNGNVQLILTGDEFHYERKVFEHNYEDDKQRCVFEDGPSVELPIVGVANIVTEITFIVGTQK